jgi:methyl-accepting chemotaxis protein
MVVALNSMAVMMFQEAGGADQHRLTIYSFVIALALVAQAVGVCVAAAFAVKMFVKVDKLTTAFDVKTTPIIEKAEALLDELSPKLKSITTNLEQTSFTVRAKVDDLANTVEELNRTVQDANERSRVQISRVDGIVTDALATTYEVSRTVQESIKGPVRQVAGIIAGLKTGLETLIARSPLGRRGSSQNPYDL